MRRHAFLALAVVLASFAPQASAEETPGTLKLTLLPAPGKPVRFVHTMVARQTTQIQGGKIEVAADTTIEMSVEVRERSPDGTWKAVIRFGRIHGRVAMPILGTHQLDSQAPLPDDPNGKSISASICALGGNVFDVVLDPGGRVRSVGDVAKAVDATTARMKGDEAIRQVVAQAITETKVRATVDYALVATSLPSEPIRQGSAWSDSDAVPGLASGIEMTASYRHEVKEIAEGAVRLVGKGDLDYRTVTASGANARTAALIQNAEKRSATVAADCRLSAKDGLPLAATSEIHLDLGLRDPKGERSIGEMKQDVTFRLERVEKWPSEAAAAPPPK